MALVRSKAPSIRTPSPWVGSPSNPSTSVVLPALAASLDMTGTVSGVTTVPTFMDNLKSAGTISTEVLGVHFAPISGSDASDSNGALTLGGTDSTLYTGTLTWVPKSTVSPYSLYWGVDVGTITYGSTTLLASGDSAIVDTGTTLIYLPIAAYNKFLSATGGSTDSSSGLAMFTTKPTQTITIHIGTGAFTLTPAQYLVPTAQYDNFGLTTGKYYSWINNGGLFQALVNFIIGQKFLENYYSAYDTTNSRIGFATAV
ncbi:acid protease [Clavulina sp. PMI_390]|nr:acid protease [Clavulina sp. PMI_390]